MARSQLPFGWVCFSNVIAGCFLEGEAMSQLPFGWVCFSNMMRAKEANGGGTLAVSIAFRLGLFL